MKGLGPCLGLRHGEGGRGQAESPALVSTPLWLNCLFYGWVEWKDTFAGV